MLTRVGRDLAADGSDVGSEQGQVSDQIIGGGREGVVGHRVECVEDEQR